MSWPVAFKQESWTQTDDDVAKQEAVSMATSETERREATCVKLIELEAEANYEPYRT